MTPPLIDHIGILVPDLEQAIERWSVATEYTFSAIHRYRTDRYSDHSDPEPHHHDARISFSKEGPPYLELMEFYGHGTHSEQQGEGFHHFGIVDHPDIERRMRELAALGFRDDGKSLDASGAVLLWFTDKDDLNGMRLEYVSSAAQPIVRDDGSEPHRDGRGAPTLWNPETD